MTIKQLMNTLIDTNAELLESTYEEFDENTIMFYIGKIVGQLDVLQTMLKEKGLS